MSLNRGSCCLCEGDVDVFEKVMNGRYVGKHDTIVLTFEHVSLGLGQGGSVEVIFCYIRFVLILSLATGIVQQVPTSWY